jgi:hypothetical protein
VSKIFGSSSISQLRSLPFSFALLWERYSGSPEVFNTQARRAESLPWPLRPELVESTYMLYRATKDDSYLSFGERVVYDIANRTRVGCGLAALENVEMGQQQDRMHSFVVAETLPVRHTTLKAQRNVADFAMNSTFTYCLTSTIRSIATTAIAFSLLKVISCRSTRIYSSLRQHPAKEKHKYVLDMIRSQMSGETEAW